VRVVHVNPDLLSVGHLRQVNSGRVDRNQYRIGAVIRVVIRNYDFNRVDALCANACDPVTVPLPLSSVTAASESTMPSPQSIVAV